MFKNKCILGGKEKDGRKQKTESVQKTFGMWESVRALANSVKIPIIQTWVACIVA